MNKQAGSELGHKAQAHERHHHARFVGDVDEVAVIGALDSKWGETVKAVVVLKPGQVATVEDLMGFCGGHLAGYKWPRSVDFVDAPPRNPSGKVLKNDLREKYWAGRGRRVN